jgi:hypothetical protein
MCENPCLREIRNLEAHHPLTGTYNGYQTPQSHPTYNATDVASTLKNNPSLLVEEEIRFSNKNGLGINMKPIRIVLARASSNLLGLSRLNWAKLFTLEMKTTLISEILENVRLYTWTNTKSRSYTSISSRENLRRKLQNTGFEVFTVVYLKSSLFWNVTSCTWLGYTPLYPKIQNYSRIRYVDSLLGSLRNVDVGNVAYVSDWAPAPVLPLVSLAR